MDNHPATFLKGEGISMWVAAILSDDIQTLNNALL